MLKLFNCDVLFYEQDKDVRIPELLRSISTWIQKGEGMADIVGQGYENLDPFDNLQSGYHPIGASILTVTALFNQLLWQIFRILRLERSKLDFFSSWRDIEKHIDKAEQVTPEFLSSYHDDERTAHVLNIKSNLKAVFGVKNKGNDPNRMMPWKELLLDLRDRFLHNSIYLLRKHFKLLKNALREASPFADMYRMFLRNPAQGEKRLHQISTKGQEYECQFQVYRILLFQKLRELMNVFTGFCEQYPQLLPDPQPCKEYRIFDTLMVVYDNAYETVDNKSIVAHIEYQMDLEEGIARGFLSSYTEDVIPGPYSAATLAVPNSHPIAFYSITYTGYRFLQMCVLTIASSFDQIMWCLIQDDTISYFGRRDSDVINNIPSRLKTGDVDVLGLLGYDANGSSLLWKWLLKELRNRFVHRGTFLLRNDFDMMEEIVGKQETPEALIIEYLKTLYKNMKDFMEVVKRSMEDTTQDIQQ